ncbi:MAG: hypothetical protein LC657_07365, partial [Desulfobacteraceae bacterium]|nr:hypothetical protein [Desulfobacteraceae bacterium]
MKSDLMSYPKFFPVITPLMVMVFFLVILCQTVPAVQARADDTAPVIKEVRVDILGGTETRQAELHAMAMKIVRFQPGDRFTARDLDTTITLLKQTRQFSNIDVPDQDLDAPSIPLVFRLTPVMLVRKITVNGAFPIFSNAVIKATDYRVGSAFDPGLVEKNANAVKTLMADNGYVDANVDIAAVSVQGLHMEIVINITKNIPLRIT